MRAKEDVAMGSWRVGRKLGRTLYVDDVCVGMVDTPALASEIVHKMSETWPCSMCDGAPHPKGKSHSQCFCKHLRCEAGSRRCLKCGVVVNST